LQQWDEKVIQQKTRLKLPEVVASDSKSNPKSSKAPKPNFREPTASKVAHLAFFAKPGNKQVNWLKA